MSEEQVLAIVAAIIYAGGDGPGQSNSYNPEAAVKIARAILKVANEGAA
jgi:hypothetical protein